MDSWFQPAVAPPAPGYANSYTRKRRLQRKHTAASYKLLKAKLLQCIKPMPSAVYSADLEKFRSDLYTEKENHAPASSTPIAEESHQTTLVCSWCGIWQPLPVQTICSVHPASIEEIDTSLHDPDVLDKLREVDKAVDALLDASLCQAGIYDSLQAQCRTEKENAMSFQSVLKWKATGDTISHDEVSGNMHRISPVPSKPLFSSYDVSLKTSTWKKYSFKRTSGSTSIQPEWQLPPSPQLYTTDETTGECKTQ